MKHGRIRAVCHTAELDQLACLSHLLWHIEDHYASFHILAVADQRDPHLQGSNHIDRHNIFIDRVLRKFYFHGDLFIIDHRNPVDLAVKRYEIPFPETCKRFTTVYLITQFFQKLNFFGSWWRPIS